MNFVQWKHSSLSLCFCSVHLNQVTGKGECLLREFCCFRIKMLHIVKKKKNLFWWVTSVTNPRNQTWFPCWFHSYFYKKKKVTLRCLDYGSFSPCIYSMLLLLCYATFHACNFERDCSSTILQQGVHRCNNNIQYYVLPQCLTYHSPMVKTTQC